MQLMQKPFFMDSDILYEDDLKTIGNWINPNKTIKLTLLFSAKNDGCDSNIFHKK